MVTVPTLPDFQLDLEAIASAITPRTKAVLLNSPNNPSGAIYTAGSLRRLGELVEGLDQPICVLSDEPYREICFGPEPPPDIGAHAAASIVCYSWSKSFGLAGERIGYLAVSPRLDGAEELIDACVFANRVLGFVNAPALWQWVVSEAIEAKVEMEHYREKVSLLCDALEEYGYDLTRPAGAFYVFPRTPIPDDVAFVRRLQQEGILAVPGRGFGLEGYIRLSMTADLDTVQRSLPGFRRAINKR
jgi:aspartate aminotransferase